MRCPRLLAAGLLVVPLVAAAERPAVRRSTGEREIVPKESATPVVPSKDLETRSGGGTLQKKAAPVRGGLKKLPLDLSVELTRPMHPQDPVRITARKTGEPTFHQVKMEVRITLTCDATKVVKIEPSSFATPRTIFQAFEQVNEKTVTVEPKSGEGWRQYPSGCFYSITGDIDPEHHIPEPNEYNNRQTLQYSGG